MRAEIISVGDEVLRGDIVNTNTSFLSARLSELGFTVHHQCSVGDTEEDLLAAVRKAIGRSHVTVFTGGLGPTEDDLTKETVAKAIGRGLYLDEETAGGIKSWFASRGVQMTDNNLKQALGIEGSEILKNNNGTAPGIYVRQGNQVIVLLPGPPRELEPLFYEQVLPRLEKFTDSKNSYITLKIFGIGESALEGVIKDLLYTDNPHAACYAKTGEVEVRIIARDKTEEGARLLAVDLANRMKERIGSFIYSEQGCSLAETVVGKLAGSKKKIALAESCTGGLMASEITAIAGASAVFDYGISPYADWVKKRDLDVDRSVIEKHTSISSAAAAELAKGALNAGRADIGVGITGQAGPLEYVKVDKEVGLVHIAVADKDKVVVKEFKFGSNRGREYIRILAVKNAFDMTRRFLDDLPVEDAAVFKHKEVADLSRKEEKGAKKNGRRQKLYLLTAALFAAATLYIAFGRADGPNAALSYNSRVKIDYSLASEEPPVSLSGLYDYRAVNPETVGMIAVPGAGYGGVVVQTGDNDYYKAYDFYRAENPLGCLHIDAGAALASKLLSNITIYGSGRSEEQFGFLSKYTDMEFLKANPQINLETLYFHTRGYKVLAVFYADSKEIDGGLEHSGRFKLEDFDTFADFVVNAKMRSMYNMPVDALFGDRFITLVAGSGAFENASLVILAREIRPGEDAKIAVDEIERNEGVVYPDKWYAVNGSMPSGDKETQYDKWLAWLKDCAGVDTSSDDVPEDKPPVITVGSDGEEEAVGAPGDTGEGTGMNGPSTPPSGGGPDTDPGGEGGVPAGQITVTSASTGRRISGTPLEIVSMIVEAEVGPSFHPEAIKAQAVATITYLKYSYRTSSAPVMPLLSASKTVKNLVAEVIDVAMTYNGAFIYSPYCSSMAGRSNACDEVWVQSLSYLVSVESKYDSEISGYSRTYTWSKDEMKKILEGYYEIKLSDSPENWLQVLNHTSGGYVGNMSIDGKYSTTGSRFRANCVFIRSAAFVHSYDPEAERFTITTSGYGHGVGMSQHGANLYARYEGMGYRQILSHYYTGVSFASANWS